MHLEKKEASIDVGGLQRNEFQAIGDKNISIIYCRTIAPSPGSLPVSVEEILLHTRGSLKQMEFVKYLPFSSSSGNLNLVIDLHEL